MKPERTASKARLSLQEEPVPVCGRLLLVDDHAGFRAEFNACFEEYEIVEAASGDAALEILSQPNQIDIVLLDFVMPGLNGLQVLERIRKSNPDIGVIILTGHGSKDLVLNAFRDNVDDYVEKPLHVDETRKVIERVLEARGGIPGLNASNSKDKIERVKCFVQRNYFRKIRLKDASEVVYLSPKYLSRVFREETGVPFEDYVLRLKMAKAKDLLEKTGLTVDQITFKLGYANSESFTRQFKKRTGFTPSGYRRDKIGGKTR